MAYKILFMDDEQIFLNAWSSVLQDAGYVVHKATTTGEARRIMREEVVHLAILDIHMDHLNYNVTDGLSLAQEEEFKVIPKIMLTADKTSGPLREALNTGAAVRYVWKGEGEAYLLQTVAEVLRTHIKFNPNLEIKWNPAQPISLAGLVSALEPELPAKILPARVEQMENLLGMLFFRHDQVRVNRLLWRQHGRLAVEIAAFSGGTVDQYIAVCGLAGALRHDQALCQEYPHLGVLTDNALADLKVTMNYAGWTWPVGQDGGASEEIFTLGEIYCTRRESSVRKTLEDLHENTLRAWLRQGKLQESQRGLGQIYREHLGLSEAAVSAEITRQKLDALARWGLTSGLLRLDISETQVMITVDHKSHALPNPYHYLLHPQELPQPQVLMGNSPGNLDWDTILVSSSGHTWLSDFSRVGVAPIWDSYVSLETSLRFKYIEADELLELYEFEVELLKQIKLGENAPGEKIKTEHRKAANLIQTIRGQAAGVAGTNELLPYLICLYFYTAQGLVNFDPQRKLTISEIKGLLYRVILASLLVQRISAKLPENAANVPDLKIDEANRAVRLNGQLVDLAPREYELLLYFYHRPGQICTHEEIIRDLKYGDPNHSSTKDNLYMIIKRLRQKIEPNPDHPEILINVPGMGYKLKIP